MREKKSLSLILHVRFLVSHGQTLSKIGSGQAGLRRFWLRNMWWEIQVQTLLLLHSLQHVNSPLKHVIKFFTFVSSRNSCKTKNPHEFVHMNNRFVGSTHLSLVVNVVEVLPRLWAWPLALNVAQRSNKAKKGPHLHEPRFLFQYFVDLMT